VSGVMRYPRSSGQGRHPSARSNCCTLPALDIPRRQDAPHRHRLREPLELRCPQILEVEVTAEHRARRRADDDLVRLRPAPADAPPGSASRRPPRSPMRCPRRSGRRRSPARWRCRSAPRARPRRACGLRHSAPPSHRRCRDPPAPNARPRPHGRAGSQSTPGCRRPCTSRQSRHSV
jgi:hypothetical protein